MTRQLVFGTISNVNSGTGTALVTDLLPHNTDPTKNHGNPVSPERGGRAPIITLATVAIRYRAVLIAFPALVAVVAVLLAVALRDQRADSSFIPQGTGGGVSPRVLGIAAQFGIDVGGEDGASPQFYATLLRSRGILTSVVEREFEVPADPSERSGAVRESLANILGVRGELDDERLLNAVDKLRGRLDVTTDLDASLVRVSVRAPWADLAEQVNRALLDGVSRFNQEVRQSNAAAERRFVQGRLEAARDELREAEDSVRGFFEANRQVQDSPRLLAEAARLQRQVDLAQSVYTTLAQALEQARIDEVRNTPVITVIDAPEGSARPSTPLAFAGILGLVLGLIVACGVVLLREYYRYERRLDPEAYGELRALLAKGHGP